MVKEMKIDLESVTAFFNFLNDGDKVGDFLESLTEAERAQLYSHPLLNFYDLLP